MNSNIDRRIAEHLGWEHCPMAGIWRSNGEPVYPRFSIDVNQSIEWIERKRWWFSVDNDGIDALASARVILGAGPEIEKEADTPALALALALCAALEFDR